MREFTFHTELWLPRGRDEVFPFFAEARNLEAITPPWLNFEVLTPAPVAMRAGALIDYRIRVHGIPIRWRTEIVEWNAPRRFVDVQLRGPYTSGITPTLSRSAAAAHSAWMMCATVRAAGR